MYVEPELWEEGEVQRHGLKANDGTQVNEGLTHTVHVDGEPAHDVNEAVVWRVELQQRLVVVIVSALHIHKLQVTVT